MDEIQLATKLEALKSEYDKGQQMLADLQREGQQLQESLLRISGAIQVLEELQGEESDRLRN